MMRTWAGASRALRMRALRRTATRVLLRAGALLAASTTWACAEGSCKGDACPSVCTDAECESGSRCVNNSCRPSCENDDVCRADDRCKLIDTDYGKRGRFCFGPELTENPYLVSEAGVGASQACRKNSDCSTDPAQRCVDGACLTVCQLHEHCGTAGSCTGDTEDVSGARVLYCEPDAFEHAAGQYGSRCLGGRSDCDEAAGFRCISSGEGDTDSYCAGVGCSADEECPSGYFCRHDRASNVPCEDACGVTGDASDANCVPNADIGPGRPFDCESSQPGLELRICSRRSFCNACETDADCRGLPDQVCARGADGTRSCTRVCDPVAGSCPWGSATECKLYDTDLGLPTCGHRFWSCSGGGNGCEPCLDDRDCNAGFCSVNGYSGEQFCVSFAESCSCDPASTSCSGGGCPKTPDGREMNCVSREQDAPPSVCYGASEELTGGGSLFACWAE
jgi:hypothetical protein